ncbi:uncharacterized protein N7469_001299 [Penicillium citrinum]|uniref:EF-hand domain-containing protein n=1 Tax=Penicillium citrinum TaxID=5077 RepID=A0A9W9PEB8_PENCI|nr:uncharacterized protein N7469_001299 [Penicillium citrinum]KAJ5242972.1 hypothetical protein N7469_001299 [Penicillium citrinum]
MRHKLGIAANRLSTHRFEQIPDHPTEGMPNPNDVTIEIPLEDAPNGQNGHTHHWGSNPETVDRFGVNEKDGMASGSGTDAGVGSGPGRRRRGRVDSDINDLTHKPADSPEDGKVNTLGRIYQAIYNFSIVTRYMIYVFPIGVLIAIPIIVGATVAKDAYIGGVHLYWFFTWIEVVWVSLWGCKIFAKFIPYVFQTLCGFVSSGTRKYALILRALETPITIVLWCVISLVTFLPIMRYGADNNSDVSSWEKSVKNILFALLVCSLIFLAEKALVQLISISYHRKQFDAKIKESKRNVYLVGLLFEASRNMFPVYCPEFRDEDDLIFDSLLAQGTKKDKKRSSMMPLRMIREVGRQVGHNVGRVGDKVTTAFGNVASELTGKQVFNPTATHSIVVQALERKRCAAALARRIWMSFVVEGRDALYIEDIVEVLGPELEAEADECFSALDKDGNGDISLDEMILTITEFGRMRKSLNHSMHDVDQAIRVLDNLLLSVAFVVGVLVFISFVTTGFGTVIAAGATSLLSLSFVFATTAQEVLGSCIFLFVKHPFDIGDRIEVSDKPFVVERISLLFSVLRNVNDHRITQVPNNILNSLWVDNFTRANAMHEQLTVPVAFDTSFADVQFLREEMEAFVRDKDNSRDFQPDIDIEVLGVGDMDKLELRVDIRHKSNWSNETVRAARRSKFMCALVLAVRKIPVRAPGVAAEESKEDGDDKGDDEAVSNTGNSKTDPANDEKAGLAAGFAASEGLSPNTAQTTGFDHKRSSGTITKRGSQASEAAIADRLNLRSPAVDVARDNGSNAGLYRTTTNASNQSQSLSVNNGTSGNIQRGLSTGHRKAGTHISYQGQEADVPRPLSPVRAGMTPSNSEVPILQAPAPPGSRGSARYEPSGNQQRSSIIASPEAGYTSTYYYNQENPFDPVSTHGMSAAQHSQERPPSQHYEMDRYDPVSPPSVHSTPQPPQTDASGRRPSLISRMRRDQDKS